MNVLIIVKEFMYLHACLCVGGRETYTERRREEERDLCVYYSEEKPVKDAELTSESTSQ